MNQNKSWIWHLAYIYIITGALNWGLLGTLNFNAIHFLLGDTFATFAYVIIGISSLYLLFEYLMNFINENVKYD